MSPLSQTYALLIAQNISWNKLKTTKFQMILRRYRLIENIIHKHFLQTNGENNVVKDWKEINSQIPQKSIKELLLLRLEAVYVMLQMIFTNKPMVWQ